MYAAQAYRPATPPPLNQTPDLHQKIHKILIRDFWSVSAGLRCVKEVFPGKIISSFLLASFWVAVGVAFLFLSHGAERRRWNPTEVMIMEFGAVAAFPFLFYHILRRNVFHASNLITLVRVESRCKDTGRWIISEQENSSGRWKIDMNSQSPVPFDKICQAPPEGRLFVLIRRRITSGTTTHAAIALKDSGRMNMWLRPYGVTNEAVRPMAPELQPLLNEFSWRCEAILAEEQAEKVRAMKREWDQKKDAWKGVVLDPKIKDELFQSAMEFATGSPAASKGLLLYGPPGTGKTLIAKRLAETMGCTFFATTVAELKGRYIGESAMHTKQVWTNALACQRAVLFVDECEGVFASRDSFETDSYVQEIVQTFLAQWDGFTKQRTVWVVGATNHRDKIDPAIRSRFGLEIEIPLPGGDERLQILSHELSAKGRRVTLPKEAKEFTQGFSGRDLENLAGRILRKMGTQTVLTPEMLAEVTAFKRTQGSTASDADATWDRLILPEKTLTQLKNTVTIFQKAEEFAKVGVSVPRGILLSGPAGTGKTQVARTMAKEGGLQFIAATTADLKAGYIGQSGQKVKELFARARACTPCILFLDELDIAAPERSRTNDSFSHEIVGQLLQELDGVQSIVGKIFLLGATNHPGSIDSAILSRFPSHIEIPLPDEDAREKILRAFLGKKPVAFDLGELRGVARRLAGKSGRDIRSIVERAEQTAVARAINDGGAEHFKLRVDDLV